MSETPVISQFNRAERREMSRKRRREERAKQRLAWLWSHEAFIEHFERTHMQCPRCHLCFIDHTRYRCQCQVEQLRQCAICYRAFMASQQSWRQNNVCAECTKALGESRANEEASRSAAYDASYARRAWDDEQHREAMEAMEER